jgi:tRNA A37 N6-isopentenylltransferase MiaA
MGTAETRQYAKRQRTWLRGNMIAWREVSAQEMEISAADFVSFIQSAH